MKKIIILNQDAGYLMIDMCNAFHEAGFEVHLITGKIKSRNVPLNLEIKTHKIIAYNRNSSFGRISTWLIGSLQMFWLILLKFRNSKLLIVSNPPFAHLLPFLLKNPFDLLVYDIYPDALYQLNILSKNSIFVKWWEKANRKIYPKALNIYTLSEGMKEKLTQYEKDSKIEIIPLWTDNQFLKPTLKAENPFLRNLGLSDKFIVMYSGNLGKTHDVLIIPEIASQIKNPAIVFIIIGEGNQRKTIEDKVKKMALTNVLLLPYQTAMQLPYSLGSADVGIVTLGSESSSISVPSKTYNLMSVGAVLLTIADHQSELAILTEKYQIGKNFNRNQVREMADYILFLEKHTLECARIKGNSVQASSHFDKEKFCRRIVNNSMY